MMFLKGFMLFFITNFIFIILSFFFDFSRPLFNIDYFLIIFTLIFFNKNKKLFFIFIFIFIFILLFDLFLIISQIYPVISFFDIYEIYLETNVVPNFLYFYIFIFLYV